MPKKQHHIEERELVAGCVRNDRRSQEALYRRFFPTMLRMCQRHTRNRDEALEIINSGFLRVFQKLHTFQFKGSLEGWIRRLVYHSLADYYRKADRNLHFLSVEDRDAPVPSEGLQNLYLEDILKLVDFLPNATRDVFVLYAIDGFNHREIGEKLNISEGTSKWHLSNARKRLKQLMDKHYKTLRHHAG